MAPLTPGYEQELAGKLKRNINEWNRKNGGKISGEEIAAIASTAASGKYDTKGLGATLPQHSRYIELIVNGDNKGNDNGNGNGSSTNASSTGTDAATSTNTDTATSITDSIDDRLGITIGGRYSTKILTSNITMMEAGRSFGSMTLADKIAMHLAANKLATKYGIILIRNTGEGGALPWELFGKPEHRAHMSPIQLKALHDFTSEILDYNHICFDSPDLKEQFIDLLYQRHYPLIVQAASGMFWREPEYLLFADGIEIKIGQGAKIGHGGLLPGRKVNYYVAMIRGIPIGIDARSLARQGHILGPENLTRYVLDLRENGEWETPIIVKVGASYVDADTKIIIKSCADAATIDGLTGGTGAAPRKVQNEIGINTEPAIILARKATEGFFALTGYDTRFKIIVSGGINDYEQALKARALGGDAVAMGTAFMIAADCVLALTCDKNCVRGITTNPELYPIIDNVQRIVNFVLAQTYKQSEIVRKLGRIPTKGDLRAANNFVSAFADIPMKDGRTYHDKVLLRANALADEYLGSHREQTTYITEQQGITKQQAEPQGQPARQQGEQQYVTR